MKELKKQLKLISGSLTNLSARLDEIAEQIDQLKPAKDDSAIVKKSSDGKKTASTKIISAKSKAAKTESDKKRTIIDIVFESIKRSRNGITIANLLKKTDLKPKQLSNSIFKLTRSGKVKAISRGVYVKA